VSALSLPPGVTVRVVQGRVIVVRATGPAGPNVVTATTATPLTGLLYGDGTAVTVVTSTTYGRGLLTLANQAALQAAVGAGGAAAAGTLTGTTLAGNVVASSLTSVGTLTSLTVAGAASFAGGLFAVSAPTGTEPVVWLKGNNINSLGFRANGATQLGSGIPFVSFNFYAFFGEFASGGGIWRNQTTQYVLFNGDIGTTDLAGPRGVRAVSVDAAYPTFTIQTIASQTAPALKVLASDGTTTVASIGAAGALAITTGSGGGVTNTAGDELLNVDVINNYNARNPMTSGNAYYGIASAANTTGSVHLQAKGANVASFAPDGAVTLRPQSASVVGLTLQGTASYTANLLELWGVSSTSTDRAQAAITATWADPNDATRRGTLSLGAYYLDALQTAWTVTAGGTGTPSTAITGTLAITSTGYGAGTIVARGQQPQLRLADTDSHCAAAWCLNSTEVYLRGNNNNGNEEAIFTQYATFRPGELEVDNGVILKSPDGTRFRITVSNAGVLAAAAV
jgi:hypothetical protein